MTVEEITDDPLARFLDETRIRFDPLSAPPMTAAPRTERHPLWGTISGILAAGYGERPGTLGERDGQSRRPRTTPSAGAIYPFEVLVALKDGARYRLYTYDVAGYCLGDLGAVPAAEFAALLDGPAPDAVVAVVGRPWRSMRKYGRRGYRYTLLDGGHAVTNLALAAADAGLRPVIRLRFDRRRAAETLSVGDLCREPQALITLDRSSRSDRSRVTMPVRLHVAGTTGRDDGDEELEAWRTISAVSAYHGGMPWAPAFGRTTSVEPGRDDAADGIALPGARAAGAVSFREAAAARTSARGFLDRPMSLAALGGLLSSVRRRVAVDAVDGPAVGLRLLVRDVDGLAPGSYTYQPGRHVLRHAGPGTGAAQIVAACQNQALAGDAALLVALHVPRAALVGPDGRQGLAETHFHAAAVSQRMNLAAAAYGLGLTGLGGFDSARIADLTRLDPGDEVVFVLAVGTPDAFAVKWDRAPIAYSHGLRPRPRD